MVYHVARLKETVAIVTGAGAGIGEATAKLLAVEGAKVCVADLSEEHGTRVAQEIEASGGDAMFVQGDVSKEEDAETVVNETVARFGRIDILFNNAGIVIPGKLDECTTTDWDKTMTVNVRSIFLMSKHALPYLKETQGVIINTASSVAIKGVKDRASYTASKGAVLSLSRAMAVDYVADKVRVNCICPGTTDTPSLKDRLSKFDDPDETRKQFVARQPLGRFGKPEEIAEGVLFLITNEFCTGTVLSVDGGMTM
jgi:meso-butanediol dehydrogenase / (S,S)-butanediol dehydrogenase / diacetyl reductase